MKATAERSNVKKKDAINIPIIDTDVHERLVSIEDLLPYMKEPFLSYMKNWTGWGELKYTHPIGGSRLDAMLPNGNVPGSDLGVLQKQLLDENNIEYAMLTGLFYPSTMETQFELAAELASAYNEWFVENWLEKDKRFLGSIQVAYQMPETAVREIGKMGRSSPNGAGVASNRNGSSRRSILPFHF